MRRSLHAARARLDAAVPRFIPRFEAETVLDDQEFSVSLQAILPPDGVDRSKVDSALADVTGEWVSLASSGAPAACAAMMGSVTHRQSLRLPTDHRSGTRRARLQGRVAPPVRKQRDGELAAGLRAAGAIRALLTFSVHVSGGDSRRRVLLELPPAALGVRRPASDPREPGGSASGAGDHQRGCRWAQARTSNASLTKLSGVPGPFPQPQPRSLLQ